MTMILLHVQTPTGPDKQLALNTKEILRLEEVEGGTTQVIQSDRAPTTVKESLDDILNALDEDVVTVGAKAEAKPPADTAKAHQPIHAKAGAK